MAYLTENRKPLTFQLQLRRGVETLAITGTLQLDDASSTFLRIDPGAANREVRMPASNRDGVAFWICHEGTLNSLLLRDSTGATIGDVSQLGPGEVALVVNEGGTWEHMGIPVEQARLNSGTIAAAAVATLNATPVEMLPAPAAGFAIIVDYIWWFLDFGTVQYDGTAPGEDLVAKYTNAAGDEVCGPVDHLGFGDAVADTHSMVRSIPVAPVPAAPIMAHILNGEWFAAAGDSDIDFQISFRVVKVP